MSRSIYTKYDPRLRNMIAKSGDVGLFPSLKIPVTTRKDWLKKGPVEYVTLPEFNLGVEELVMENQKLKAKLQHATTEKDLIVKTIKICGFELQCRRIPNAEDKQSLLDVIKSAAKVIPIKSCLNIAGLSSQRFYAWVRRATKCELDDQSTCPKSSPTKLTIQEEHVIKDMVTDPELRHFSIAALCWYGKKIGRVFASPQTWSNVIKKHKLIRPGKRVYPPKPKIGIRATKPLQILHVDQTIIRFVDGSKCFIRAVIDNFSRYVLAHSVTRDYSGVRTKDVIEKALVKAKELGLVGIPSVICDGGSENHNKDVNSLVLSDQIKLVTAQIDIVFSNSIIEALFHRMKNRYLYFQQLTNVELQHTDKFLEVANELIPHSGIGGATPLEMIKGTWPVQLERIQSQAKEARQQRMAQNRAMQCRVCPT